MTEQLKTDTLRSELLAPLGAPLAKVRTLTLFEDEGGATAGDSPTEIDVALLSVPEGPVAESVSSGVELLAEGAAGSTWEDDPYFEKQWHLDNSVTGIDINVLDVWKDYDGSGVKIAIWDDGVEYDHPDLAANYDTGLHIPESDGGPVHDPYPENLNSAHGTAVGGIIAGVDNDIGIVGVAYGSTIAGVDMFEDPTLDFIYSFQHLSDFDVTNHSWGFTGAYAVGLRSADPETQMFFNGWQQSVIDGRGGLGTINVTSAGNDRTLGRNTNDSGMSAMPQTIAVAAVGYDGYVSFYSTPGSSLLVSAPSSDRTLDGDARIITTDRVGDAGYNFTDPITSQPSQKDLNPSISDLDYTTFGGTSAAAPIVSGVVALILEANPNLGWRDVQEILSLSARHVGSDIGAAPALDELNSWLINDDFRWNGGGRHFSNDYGYGLVDAHAAVRLAETWHDAPEVSGNWRKDLAASWTGETEIDRTGTEALELTFLVESDIELEMIELDLGAFASQVLNAQTTSVFEAAYFQALDITLTSPGGTVSDLAAAIQSFRYFYLTDPEWTFTSNAFRGEDATGEWTLTISDGFPDTIFNTLLSADLFLLGGEATNNDTYVFTNEFSDFADGTWGHSTIIRDTDGGIDTINAAAVTSDTVVDLVGRTGTIDGVAVSDLRGIENVFSGDGDDVLTAGKGKNWLRGGRGDDEISAGDGDDTVDGGAGNDYLVGGRGADTIIDGDGMDVMFGGLGGDTFILFFDGVLDVIRDFDVRADLLLFQDIVLANLSWSNDGDKVRVDIDDGAMSDTLFLYNGGARPLDAADLNGDMFMFA